MLVIRARGRNRSPVAALDTRPRIGPDPAFFWKSKRVYLTLACGYYGSQPRYSVVLEDPLNEGSGESQRADSLGRVRHFGERSGKLESHH